jgi:hypothetical protein
MWLHVDRAVSNAALFNAPIASRCQALCNILDRRTSEIQQVLHTSRQQRDTCPTDRQALTDAEQRQRDDSLNIRTGGGGIAERDSEYKSSLKDTFARLPQGGEVSQIAP